MVRRLSGWFAGGAVLAAMPWLVGTAFPGQQRYILHILVFTGLFGALALLLERHYEAACVPMLPVVSGTAATARAVLTYSVLLLGTTLLPWVFGTFGLLYLIAAGMLGSTKVNALADVACLAKLPLNTSILPLWKSAAYRYQAPAFAATARPV